MTAWRNKLTKKELKHLKEDAFAPGVRITLGGLKRIFEGQAEMRRKSPDIEPCWTCKRIAKKLGLNSMAALNEIFEDWTIIKTPKQLRKAVLCASKILAHQGNEDLARQFATKVKHMPKRMSKEAINVVLFNICVEIGLIK